MARPPAGLWRVWTLSIVAACLLAVGAAAGCGGGDGSDQLTAEEYGAELNAICEEVSIQAKEVGAAQSNEELVEIGPRLLEVIDAAIADIEALEPPDELADTADAFIANKQEQRELVAAATEAAADEDEVKLGELFARGSRLDQEEGALAEELGAPACA